nr:gamma-glutamyl-gamma-aminobutyrate hydrolase family protein [Streptomyces sp. SID8352]
MIGITGRRLPAASLPLLEERYRHTRIDMYFTDFPRRVHRAGGIPVELPYEAGTRETVTRLDGLVITGGHDIHPALWGGGPDDAAGPIDVLRDEYEIALATAALDLLLPVLGVCRGAQVLNVARGGQLVPHLPDHPVDHVSGTLPVHTLQHEVRLAEGSLARRLYGPSTRVNSLHHQAVGRCGRGITVTGRAPDGTAEVIEVPGSPVLGVQWHPEWMSGPDPAFEWLAAVSAGRAAAHRGAP